MDDQKEPVTKSNTLRRGAGPSSPKPSQPPPSLISPRPNETTSHSTRSNKFPATPAPVLAASTSSGTTSRFPISQVVPGKPASARAEPNPLRLTPEELQRIREHEVCAEWQAAALRKYPEIADLMERISPLNRAVAFGRLYYGSRPEVPGGMPKAEIMELIYQHLQYEGLTRSAATLEQESEEPYSAHDLDESRLLTLLRVALTDVDRLYDLIIAENKPAELDTRQTVQDLEGLLAQLDLLEEHNEQEDVNIWDEPSDKFLLMDPKGPPNSIRAASLNKLVERLTSANEADLQFAKTFLATYLSFTRAEVLLNKLMQRYQVPTSSQSQWVRQNGPPDVETFIKPIHLRVCNVLRQWMNEYWGDFEDNEKLLSTLKQFAEMIQSDAHVSWMVVFINRKLTGKEQRQHHSTVPPPEPKVPRNIFSPKLTWLDVDEEEIARQVTLEDWAVYSRIRPSELLSQAWNKPKYKHKSPNVLRFSERFNKLSYFVQVNILETERLRDRVRIASKFIKVMEHLRSMNNFFALFAFYSAFGHNAVFRLKWTKAELPAATSRSLAEAEKLVSSAQGHKAYKDALSKVTGPCIPFLGMWLTDLIYADEGMKDDVDGLINFAKRRSVYAIISRVLNYQMQPFNFIAIPQIAALLDLHTPMLSEEQLFAMSQAREPKDVQDASELM